MEIFSKDSEKAIGMSNKWDKFDLIFVHKEQYDIYNVWYMESEFIRETINLWCMSIYIVITRYFYFFFLFFLRPISDVMLLVTTITPKIIYLHTSQVCKIREGTLLNTNFLRLYKIKPIANKGTEASMWLPTDCSFFFRKQRTSGAQ